MRASRSLVLLALLAGAAVASAADAKPAPGKPAEAAPKSAKPADGGKENGGYGWGGWSHGYGHGYNHWGHNHHHHNNYGGYWGRRLMAALAGKQPDAKPVATKPAEAAPKVPAGKPGAKAAEGVKENGGYGWGGYHHGYGGYHHHHHHHGGYGGWGRRKMLRAEVPWTSATPAAAKSANGAGKSSEGVKEHGSRGQQ